MCRTTDRAAGRVAARHGEGREAEAESESDGVPSRRRTLPRSLAAGRRAPKEAAGSKHMSFAPGVPGLRGGGRRRVVPRRPGVIRSVTGPTSLSLPVPWRECGPRSAGIARAGFLYKPALVSPVWSGSESPRGPVRGNRRLENPAGRGEVFGLQDVGDPHLVLAEARRRVEAVRRSDHDRGAVELEVGEEPLGEVLAVLHRDARDEVEGALGLAEEDAGDLRQLAEEDVPPMAVLLDDALDVFGAEEGGAGAIACARPGGERRPCAMWRHDW